MSLTQETPAAPGPLESPAVPAGDGIGDLGSSSPPPGGRVLLVWDAPNLDMGLGSILGRRPTALERPRFDALGRWLLGRTAEVSAGRPGAVVEPEATVFTNIAPGSADVVRPWVDALRNVGFAVFAKPKIDEDSDVDRDMLAHIELRRNEALAALIVASADGQAFRQPLEEIAGDGVPVQVIGFREHASWALASDTLDFVDLEDIAGVFRESAWIRCPNKVRGCSRSGRCPRC
jgi:putative heme uptake system protein